MFKVRHSAKKKEKGLSNADEDEQLTINDIACLQTIKDMSTEELLEILEGDLEDCDVNLKEYLKDKENRTNIFWLRQQIETRWLRRGELGT